MMIRFVRHPVLLAVVAAVVVVAVLGYAGERARAPVAAPAGQALEKVSVSRAIMVRAPAPSPPKAEFAANAAPQIARTAKVSLLVANIDAAVRAATAIAQRSGGDVFSSDVSRSSAELSLRVPSQRFDSVMNGVAGIGRVQENSTSAEDLSASITDSGARLRNLRRTESDILKIMDRSGSVGQVMSAETQLSDVREKIETLESELKDMRLRVNYTTIDLSMQLEVAQQPVERTPFARIIAAWNAAAASLKDFAVMLLAGIVWLVVYLPVIALGLAVVIYARRRLQRSRSMA